MREIKHMRGPWRDVKHSCDETLWTIEIHAPSGFAFELVRDCEDEEDHAEFVANARLIAAAPDLYRGLALLLPVCKAWFEDAKKADPHGWQSLDDDIAVAEAAIRKAKGE